MQKGRLSFEQLNHFRLQNGDTRFIKNATQIPIKEQVSLNELNDICASIDTLGKRSMRIYCSMEQSRKSLGPANFFY